MVRSSWIVAVKETLSNISIIITIIITQTRGPYRRRNDTTQNTKNG